ncbi:hypothetical protein W97_02616 [Coniosporium apollinis CBS 100218]|uniref:Uncharacterized protein n=1 Tax=Coniosporium apollinis (strain CBS 100218) TaxID=1168221 RepID=R7YNJ7_CONA1|nr:uncharacterized protein W97_02616 [Coniosporium apollinis CBS 100218]EON63389.1 hypothetical protein W97_02616 [Coniosporium apollinis CBS 100218]
MPPNSTRRTRSRRETEIQQRSDANTPESIQTPSRKRRRVTGPDSARTTANGAERRSTTIQAAVSREATVEPTNDEADTSEVIEDETLRVISRLRTSDAFVQAVVDFSNDLDVENPSTRKAYAKIAGRQWSYYMKTPGINIGRGKEAPRSALKAGPLNEAPVSPSQLSPDPNAAFPIHIDLGPDNRISRLHAVIEYDADNEQWVLFVNSRNGLRVDDFHVEHGKRTVLRSGSVFSVNGTEMMFLLPDGEVEIAQAIMNRVKQQPKDGDDTEEGDEDSPRLPQSHLKPSSPRPGAGAQKPYQQSSQSYSQHPPQHSGHGQFSAAVMPSSTSAQPGTPGTKPGQVRVKASPAYSRGLVIESTQEIDYADESSKDFKPPHSYAQLIGQAILGTDEKKLTLSKIYDFVRENYAFYRHTATGWQNSIRHNLSLNKSFEKVPRDTHEPGKGMKWQIVPDHLEEFMKKAIPPTRGMRPSASSGPNSPAAMQASERLQGALAGVPQHQRPGSRGIKTERIKTSPRSVTPPLMAAYPTAQESYTPDRGPARRPTIRTNDLPPPHTAEARTPISANDGSRSASAPHPQYASAHGPNPPGTAPRRSHVGLTEAASQGSPPAMGSTLYAQDGHQGMLMTPLVERHKPSLAPPSSMRAPSHFMHNIMSSPAPFWKFADHALTPGRVVGWGSSPVKRKVEEMEGDDDEGDEIEEGGPVGQAGESGSTEVEGTKHDSATQLGKTGAHAQHPSSPPPMVSAEPREQAEHNSDADDSHDDSHEDMSPTRTLSRPATRQGPTRPSTATGGVQALQALGPPPRMAMPVQMGMGGLPGPVRGLGIGGLGGVHGISGAGGMNGVGKVDEEEEEGIDLAK